MRLDIRTLVTFDNLRMNTGYFVRTRRQENWIYNKTFDLCLFLKQPAIDRVTAMVYNDLKHHGNLPASCPIPPSHFIFENVTLTNIRLPPYLPETSFGFLINTYTGKRNYNVFKSKWYGRLKKVLI
ncbi:uncharacterized protein LOC118466327 [Anopheles albimanus]|nr:uncharacterized protein LOC118466327 [Anopheles albimanus]